MLLSNQVRKIIAVSVILGLSACGGGGSDSSEEVATSPETTTPTQPGTPSTDTSTSTAVEYASGIYLREHRGIHNTIIIDDDTLYYHELDKGSDSYLGKFSGLNDVSSAYEIVEAAGSYQQVSESEARIATFSSTFQLDENNIVTAFSGLSIQSAGSFLINQHSFNATTAINELSALNGQWKDANFTEFTIDDALALTAIDKNSCEISGVLTENASQTFDASLTYSNCELAGNYNGVLWAYVYDEVNYLSWLAYHEEGKAVSGSIDTILDQYESVLTTGQLTASVYTSGNNVILTKLDKIYAFNSDAAFVFNYQNEGKSENFTATGRGISSGENVFDAQTNITVEAGAYRFNMPVNYQTSSGLGGNEYFSYLDPLSLEQRLATVAGTWGGLTIAENGEISGNISGGVASSTAGNYQENIADITITLSDCSYDDVLTGVAIAIERSDEAGELEKALILSVFNDNDASVLGINTVVKM